MKILIRRPPSVPVPKDKYLRWSRYLFFAVGTIILGYVGVVLLDARLFQADQTRQFQQELKRLAISQSGDQRSHESSIPITPAEANPSKTEPMDMIMAQGTLGRIEISTIGLEAMILEGTDARTLRRAVGHIPGTPLPGQRGNIVITGHRDTFFRPLLHIRINNEIRLTTLGGSYRYLVDFTKVVEPDDTEVMDNIDDSVLTLVTCYPFYFVGPAPKRFIVRAHMIPA